MLAGLGPQLSSVGVCIALLSNECDNMARAGECCPGIRPAALWRSPIGRDGVYFGGTLWRCL